MSLILKSNDMVELDRNLTGQSNTRKEASDEKFWIYNNLTIMNDAPHSSFKTVEVDKKILSRRSSSVTIMFLYHKTSRKTGKILDANCIALVTFSRREDGRYVFRKRFNLESKLVIKNMLRIAARWYPYTGALDAQYKHEVEKITKESLE
jgi:hypothetical protein